MILSSRRTLFILRSLRLPKIDRFFESQWSLRGIVENFERQVHGHSRTDARARSKAQNRHRTRQFPRSRFRLCRTGCSRSPDVEFARLPLRSSVRLLPRCLSLYSIRSYEEAGAWSAVRRHSASPGTFYEL